MKVNTLNDLDGKQWLKFQKSWFVHNPPPRRKDVLQHPAKFPETLAEEFIRFFTKKGMNVLDPMLGTGSTLIACIQSGRNGYGIELNPKYAEIARELISQELAQGRLFHEKPEIKVMTGDARDINRLALPPMDYCITSPPYWDMLRMKGAQTQKERRETDEFDVFYSDDPADLGNIDDYEEFLDILVGIYKEVHKVLRDKAYMTVIVKNVKKKGKIFPLAWDLGREIGTFFVMKDEKIWCQDNQRLSPYGMGSAWVSNTFHHYCLHFRKE